MKNLLTTVVLALLNCIGYAQNLTLASNLSYPFSLSNIGGYTDSHGNEYALVGTYEGLSIVDVTNPSLPIEKFAVAGPQSDWREVKTWSHYAYVTTESNRNDPGIGLQIINLDYLPDSIQLTNWQGDGAIAGQLYTTHALHIDDTGFLYLYGSSGINNSIFGGSALICDIQTDPWNPHYLGHTPGPYVHDGYVRNDTLWAAHINSGYFGVYNCADKSNPVLLATHNTPNNFTHNTWLSADSRTLFTTDEVDNSYLAAYDVSDVNNISDPIGLFQTTPGSQSMIHNTHIIQVNGGEFAVTSWYKDGVVITDVTRPANMIEVARYDTYPQGSGGNWDGNWGVYPFLPSHTIVASDITNGLFVLTPNYVRACYLEGIVTDSTTNIPLNGVSVQLISTTISASSKITGDYKTGTITSGTYDIQFSKSGYQTRIIPGVTLANGVLTTLNVKLFSPSQVTVTGKVTETGTGNPVANANVSISDSQNLINVITDAAGDFTINSFIPGTYDITAGHWGHRTICSTGNSITGITPLSIVLDKGYYDDFSFDFGWNSSGTASTQWVRDEPIGTVTNGGTAANPDFDVTNDCRNLCFVTGNGAGSATSNDVDEGYTILTSPVFDATQYADPLIKYNRWFANLLNLGGGDPNDTLNISLSNGATVVSLEEIFSNEPDNSSWVEKSFKISDYITPTSTMSILIETSDNGPVYNVVEGGFDKFEVIENPLSVNEISSNNLSIKAFPNPFNNSVTIKINNTELASNASLIITNVEGKNLVNKIITPAQSTFELGKEFTAGVYFIQLKGVNNISPVLKIIKVN